MIPSLPRWMTTTKSTHEYFTQRIHSEAWWPALDFYENHQENDYWAPRPQLIRKLVTLVTLESPVLQLPNGAMIPSPGDQCGRLHSTSLDPPVLLTARRPCPLNLLGSDAALLCQGHSASTTVGAIRTLLRLIHTCHCLFVTKRCHVC